MAIYQTNSMNFLTTKTQNINIFLASKSPRRHELLKNIITDFKIISKEIEEIYPENLQLNKIAQYLSKLKAAAYLNQSTKKNLFITADTIVILNNKVLGKPKNYDDAFDMLKKLSGKTHIVNTGFSILYNEKISSFQDTTKVTFYQLTDQEIDYYIQSNQPYDKAGSYGIQEWMGYVGIKKIEGDFFNVMGLPIHRLYREINKIL
jgi:septum formation protein